MRRSTAWYRLACTCFGFCLAIVLTLGCGDDKHGSAADGGAGHAGASGSAGTTVAGSGGSNGNAGGSAATSGSSSSAAGSGNDLADGSTANDAAVPAADGGSGFPGDTFLPWAGGPDYYKKWTHGPPADASFFPIAVWLQSPPNAMRYKAVGINLFVGLYDGPTDEQLGTLKAADVPVFCDQSGVYDAHLDDSTLWGALQPDEPDNAQAKANMMGYDPCIAPQKIIDGYNTMVAKDATRPVWLGLGRGVSDTEWVGRGECTGMTDMYKDYQKGGDILSFDIYPVNGGIGLEAVAKGIDNLRLWSDYKKPVVADIEGSNIDDTTRPSPAQIKSEVWMAIVHGAAGVQYFCHRFTPSFSETDCIDDDDRAQALGEINAQVTSLAAVLNQPAVGNGVTVTSAANDKPIDTLLKRYQGASYLFAVEMRDGQTHGTFTLRDFPKSASAEVIGEQRTLSVTNGKLEDDFASYGVHLYKITY